MRQISREIWKARSGCWGTWLLLRLPPSFDRTINKHCKPPSNCQLAKYTSWEWDWKVISENMIQTVKFCCPLQLQFCTNSTNLACSPNFPLSLGEQHVCHLPKISQNLDHAPGSKWRLPSKQEPNLLSHAPRVNMPHQSRWHISGEGMAIINSSAQLRWPANKQEVRGSHSKVPNTEATCQQVE